MSPNGYISDEIAYNWLLHFHEQTKHRVQRHEKRLLLMDGHKSHMTFEFLKRCDDFNIRPFAFPPHTTHLIQPLDAEPFHQLKQRYKQRNDEIAVYHGDTGDKAIFLREMVGIRRGAMKQRTIRHAFEKRGIWPVNPNLVVEPLAAAEGDTGWYLHGWYGPPDVPATPSLASSETNSPPPTIRRLHKTINKTVRLDVSECGISPTRKKRRFNLVSRSCEIIRETQYQTDSTIRRHNKHPFASNKSSRSKKRLPKMGNITAGDAERSIAERRQREEQKAQRSIQRDRKRASLPPTPTSVVRNSTSQVDLSAVSEDPSGLFYVDNRPFS